ncbi:MAG: acyloxyacyl hydrolase, partial [Odoribacter sp.]|nr:acyloxyacyl hydrolase [Odoribacter sp.]
MNMRIWTSLVVFFSGIFFWGTPAVLGQEEHKGRFIHQLGAEFRPGYVFPTNPFLAGRNATESPIKDSYAAHLKYAFQFSPQSLPDRIWGGAYQGIGIGYYCFGNTRELGNPLSVYLFQGARIATFSSRVS